jgi:ketosteroid isomerase-like protein
MPERHEPELDPEAIIDRWLDAINSIDFAAAEALLSDNFVSHYPQSGETIRGPRNMRAILENFPGSLSEGNIERATAKVIGGHQWAMTSSFVLVRVTGVGDARTAIVRSRYPDGSMWWILNFFEFAAGKITKSTVYFARAFEPPAWRAQWVEPRGSVPPA